MLTDAALRKRCAGEGPAVVRGAQPWSGPLGTPIDVRRNGYGRQIDSFEADLTIDELPGGDFHAMFIRAPIVERVAPEITVLAMAAERPVLCRYKNVLVSSFHPELTADRRLHQYFVSSLVQGS